LSCKDCEATLENDDLTFLTEAGRAKLWLEDQSKGPGDITLYKISWRQDKKSDWRPLPSFFSGLTYSGKSQATAEKRAYGISGHFYQGFRNPRILMEKTIRNQARRLGIDLRNPDGYKDPRLRNFFKVDTVKIIKFQGDLGQIRAITDVIIRQQALKDAEAKTRDLANYYEKFFVGLFHSQFPEYGRNKAQGGDFSSQKSFIPIEFELIENAFDKIYFFPIKMLHSRF